jgi:hypothetical protein
MAQRNPSAVSVPWAGLAALGATALAVGAAFHRRTRGRLRPDPPGEAEDQTDDDPSEVFISEPSRYFTIHARFSAVFVFVPCFKHRDMIARIPRKSRDFPGDIPLRWSRGGSDRLPSIKKVNYCTPLPA